MDFIQEMGIKDLEHVVLKARDYIQLGPYFFEPGEPVLYFRNIQIALLSESTQVIAARGGFLNQPRVIWEDRSDTIFQFSTGTLNPISLNMLLDANMIQRIKPRIPIQETLKVQGNRIYLSHKPDMSKKIFYKVFELENIQPHRKIQVERYEEVEGLTGCYAYIKEISENGELISFPDEDNIFIVADYYFEPKNSSITYTMNRERKANLYSLEATFYLKDENDGLLHTGILEMPKVYIMSNINLRMGERSDPTVGNFRIVAMPENYEGYDSMICRITYLDDDIYGI